MKIRKYQPSNGTEMMIFFDHFCENCEHDREYQESMINPDIEDCPEKGCQVIVAAMVYDFDDERYPEEWIEDEKGYGVCTKFIEAKSEAAEKLSFKEKQERLEEAGQLTLF